MSHPNTYRIAFAFSQNANISISIISDVLSQKRHSTFQILDEDAWFHTRYKSDILWNQDIDAKILTATIQDGEAVRTCGSLVEWILRNAPEYLADFDKDFKGVSVFG